ncbi:hypothetical protein ACQ4PT_052773 [Festuca glaucescens]
MEVLGRSAPSRDGAGRRSGAAAGLPGWGLLVSGRMSTGEEDLPLLDSSRAEMEVGGADLRSSIKKWKIIYPVYLNSKKTVAEGRRIAAAKACPDPTCIEIADSCAFLKIPRAIELDKAYPRDFFQVGRVRVQLTSDDGSPVNPAIRTKKQLMIQIAELVPKHHGRTKKQEPAAGPSVVSTNKKKKNKNKK